RKTIIAAGAQLIVRDLEGSDLVYERLNGSERHYPVAEKKFGYVVTTYTYDDQNPPRPLDVKDDGGTVVARWVYSGARATALQSGDNLSKGLSFVYATCAGDACTGLPELSEIQQRGGPNDKVLLSNYRGIPTQLNYHGAKSFRYEFSDNRTIAKRIHP